MASASSIPHRLLAKKVVPWAIRSCAAAVTSGWAWPTSIGPEPSKKSTYSLPLSSHTRPPRPSRITTLDETFPKVPPGSTRLAFSMSPRSISLSVTGFTAAPPRSPDASCLVSASLGVKGVAISPPQDSLRTDQLPDYLGECRPPRRRRDAKSSFYLLTIENRVHRTSHQRRVLVGGDRLDLRTGRELRRCQIEDRLREAVPTGSVGADEMIGSPLCLASFDVLCDHHQRCRDIGRGGRTSALVGDDAQDRPLGCEPKHRLDEICPVLAEHPRGAEDHVPRNSRSYRTLAGFLAAPVDTERADRILLPIGSGFATVKEIVRRKVDERPRALVASSGNVGRPCAVRCPSGLRLAFGAVNGCVGGKIDRQIRRLPVQHRADGSAVGDIDRVSVER